MAPCARRLLISSFWPQLSDCLDRLRERHADGAEHGVAGSAGFAAEPEVFSQVFDFHVLQALQIAKDLGPFEFVALCPGPPTFALHAC